MFRKRKKLKKEAEEIGLRVRFFEPKAKIDARIKAEKTRLVNKLIKEQRIKIEREKHVQVAEFEENLRKSLEPFRQKIKQSEQKQAFVKESLKELENRLKSVKTIYPLILGMSVKEIEEQIEKNRLEFKKLGEEKIRLANQLKEKEKENEERLHKYRAQVFK